MTLNEFKMALKFKHIIELENIPEECLEWMYQNGNTYYLDNMPTTHILLLIQSYIYGYKSGYEAHKLDKIHNLD